VSTRVAVVGVNGHGGWHLTNIARLVARGQARLVAACDLAPVSASIQNSISALGATLYTSYERMLQETTPQIVILVTPPATHLPLANLAMAAGADVLVEKPATVRVADLDALIANAARLDRRIQIGFQSIGSYALDVIASLIADGTVGPLRHVYAAGAWTRPTAYFQRGAWAGRRFVDGVAVGDGAVANPFGHALMNCLQIAGVTEVAALSAELFCANDISSDDTSSLRTMFGGVTVNLAVTLCADRIVDPYVVAVGSRGSVRWDYTTDELRLDGKRVDLPGARDLLTDLIDARRLDRAPLCPPERCRTFTTITESLLDGPAPTRIPSHFAGGDPVRVPGIATLIERSASDGQLFSESGAPWASR